MAEQLDIQRYIQGQGGNRYGVASPAVAGGMGAMQGMNPILAAALASNGPMNWQGAGNFAQQANYSQMPVGQSMLLSGQQNFMPQMQGAYDRMGGIFADNANRSRQVNDQQFQAQLLREGRNDSNQKFTMLYDALLKPQMTQQFNTRTNSMEQNEVSPLLQLLSRFMPGGGGGPTGNRL